MKATPIVIIGIMMCVIGCGTKPPYRYVNGEWFPVSTYALKKHHLPGVRVGKKKDSGEVIISAILEYQALRPIPEKSQALMREALIARLKKDGRPPKDWYTNLFNEIVEREIGLQDQVISVLVTTSQETPKGLKLKNYSN